MKTGIKIGSAAMVRHARELVESTRRAHLARERDGGGNTAAQRLQLLEREAIQSALERLHMGHAREPEVVACFRQLYEAWLLEIERSPAIQNLNPHFERLAEALELNPLTLESVSAALLMR